jgi:hexosaminidase
MAQIFPDEYFHIGGDEVVYKQWNESPTITEFRKKNNLADGRALQAWFNTQVAQVLKKHHKRMIGWNEILHGEIPQDTVIQNWIGVEALQEAVNRHFDVVISLGYYLDWQMPAWYHYGIDPLRPDPPSADPLIKDANYDKFAALRADQSQAVALPAGSEKYILGGEAAEWTELAGPWNVDSVIWPRLGAVAERLWSPMDVRDVEYLYQRFPELNAELADLGIRVTDGPQTMRLRLAGTLEGATTLGLFAEAIEPVKYYGRNESKRPEYNTLGPFNRLADALASESIVATNFHFAVTRYLKSRNADDLAPVRLTVQRWNTNHAALDALLRNNPRLQEAKPVAESLHLATGGALDAIDYIQRGERAPAAWIAAQQTILQSAKPTADMRLVVLDSIQSLINAAGQ